MCVNVMQFATFKKAELVVRGSNIKFTEMCMKKVLVGLFVCVNSNCYLPYLGYDNYNDNSGTVFKMANVI